MNDFSTLLRRGMIIGLNFIKQRKYDELFGMEAIVESEFVEVIRIKLNMIDLCIDSALRNQLNIVVGILHHLLTEETVAINRQSDIMNL